MCVVRFCHLVLFFASVEFGCGARARHSGGRQAPKYYGHGIQATEDAGLWPNVFNVATKAVIISNSTCGEERREEFCRLSPDGKGRCGVCDALSPDLNKKHPIENAIDGSNLWWQSSTLLMGPEFEYVTVTLDLKQVYQVAYVIIKAANSPRPGSWILERSEDDERYEPWQYFATSDKECWERYGVVATKGKPRYQTDSDVICTSFYSKLNPLENGEIHISLVNGRPGANETSPELLQFTRARYVRFRFQRHRALMEPLPRWLLQEPKLNRLFYSIRDISIGGQCVCNGHASSCRHNVASGHPECECEHHACGPNCEKCCPLYNQRPWGAGSSRDARHCVPCQCHGHATSCHYEEAVDNAGLSVDINGNYNGGGVCDNCSAHTSGINCEKCIRGYFRPEGVPPDAEVPCIQCDCDRLGSTGFCAQEGLQAGLCECLPGYTGFRCDRCDSGYRGFPNCETCPCDSRGIAPMNDCEGECICKANAEGKNCDRCKPGHFALQSSNFEGCSSCYCSGVTNLCESAILEHRTIETLENWLISDISVTNIIKPTLDTDTNWLSVGNHEIPGIEAYYWLAPKEYCGNKLETYDSELEFRVNWVVMRGDTSGKPTTGPNVIIVGSNGARIAYGNDYFIETNTTIRVPLNEHGWYHVPEDVKDIVTRLRRTDYKGNLVTRLQFMEILTHIKYILLRAKFHTDQIEGSLENSVLHLGSEGFNFGASAVEKCSCPSGYVGLSCESCDYGYVRIVTNGGANREQGFCVKCDCNGHSETCNPDTGECLCEHSTVGEKCERCLPGFYGNPLTGAVDACKKCACPLLNEENNFSPSCQLDLFDLDLDALDNYVCTQCPKGYTGDHCEICDDGYYGVPTEIGGKCQQCSCGGSPCDRTTGQCLSCRGNTEGWRCERCKSAHYGDPTISNCQECLCDPQGSGSQECNNVTGQCMCKDRFTGRTCDRCETGFGNVTAGCTPCTCNPTGSLSNICNPQTGLCDCQVGVEGFHCDACQHLHYGFSETGCQSCNCSVIGSEIKQCDIQFGQCRCKPYYVGRTCNKCTDGYWNSRSGVCEKCNCDIASVGSKCDDLTGRCNCAVGVGGEKCDKCLSNYYAYSSVGCQECEVCSKEGFICDPDTGKCVCPPRTHGANCQHCTKKSWGYEPNKGCKACNCSVEGSTSFQCNITGECCCKQGYTGLLCDKCDDGYYGYPRCRRCSCSMDGTLQDNCSRDGVCRCNKFDGKCPCKNNVVGHRCDTCAEGTFGLHQDNIEGCTQCYCFGRTANCSDAGLTWGHIRLANSKQLTVTHFLNDSVHDSSFGVATNEVFVNQEDLQLIPSLYENKTVESFLLDAPLYWKLPKEFHGDRILSYGGYIRFSSETVGSTSLLPNETVRRFPIIQIIGNGIILEHRAWKQHVSPKYEVRFHESFWEKKNNGHKPSKVSRKTLMVVLQKVEHVSVRATDSRNFSKVILSDLEWDTAIEVPGNPPPHAKGVELCECPRQYNSSSCQNPSIGFFRWYNPSVSDSTIVIIGEARACECNGRSKICDIETGHCLSCADNTSGNYCEICAEGYYGDPMHGKCKPCPCPNSSKNFALSCSPKSGSSQFDCICKTGYNGTKCNRCSSGFYGKPNEPNGSCKSCNCHPHGVIAGQNKCHPETGQCNCKPGVMGKQCSKCMEPRYVLENHKCIPCDKCTQWLMDDYDDLMQELNKHGAALLGSTLEPPWAQYNLTKLRYEKLSDAFDDYVNAKDSAIDYSYKPLEELERKTKSIKNKVKKDGSPKLMKRSEAVTTKSEKLYKDLQDIDKGLVDLIKRLSDFGSGSHISKKAALKEARDLLGQIKTAKHSSTPNLQVLKKCREVKELVEDLIKRNQNTKKLHKDLETLNDSLKDFEALIDEIDKWNRETTLKNNKNEMKIRSINETLINLSKRNASMGDDLTDAKSKIATAQQNLTAAQVNIDKLNQDKKFATLLRAVEAKEGVLTQLNPDYMKKYVMPVQKHVAELQKKAREYADAFDKSSSTIDAYNASTAYNKIDIAVADANKLAHESVAIVVDAEKTISPHGKDSLYDQTYISIGDSDRLKERANNLNTHINDLKQKIDSSKLKIQTLRDSIWGNGISNKQQDAIMTDIKSSINLSNLKEIINNADNTSEAMRRIYKYAQDTYLDTFYKLERQNLEKIKKLTLSEELKQIHKTREKLDELVRLNQTSVMNANSRIEDHLFKQRTNQIAQKLEKLRNTIKKGKQIANGIQVSLGENCSRVYNINLEPSLYTDITIIFHRNTTDSNASLLYLPTSYKDFMALEIIKNELRFIWNLGQNTTVLKHNLTQLSPIEVEINRIGMNVTMKINKEVVKIHKDDKNMHSVFKVSHLDKLYIGELPSGKGDSKMRAKTKLNCCLQSVIINNKTIGLWNFDSQMGNCGGCKVSQQLSASSSGTPVYYFQGEGYTNITNKQRKSVRHEVYTFFDIKTFDENAIIIFAVDSKHNRSISVTLKDGHIVFKATFSKHEPIVLTSAQKYNTGKWVRVEISMSFNELVARLKVSDENIRANISQKIIKNDLIPLLNNDVQYFIGGVPPTFRYEIPYYTDVMDTDVSLLGGLKQIYDVSILINPLENFLHYGVISKTHLELSFRKAWFQDGGFIELNDLNNQNFSTIHFIFRTKKDNAVLMFIGKKEFEKTDYCIITIDDGHIRFEERNESQGLIDLRSNAKIVNDNQFHSVLIRKGKTLTELIIDNEQHGTAGTIDNISNKSSIFLGSLPPNIGGNELDKMKGIAFNGTIKDIMFDDNLIPYDEYTVKSFENVWIGRSDPDRLDMAPLDLKMGNLGPTTKKVTDSCKVIYTYLLEAHGVKFGDTLSNSYNSFVIHNFKQDKFWNKEFQLEFEFRTFYPTGLLLATPAKGQKHFMMLELKDGKLHLMLKLKKTKHLSVPLKVEDGLWHRVVIKSTKNKKRLVLTMRVGEKNAKNKPIRIPKKLNLARKMYIGSIPAELMIPNMSNSINQFRGCVRKLKVDNVSENLVPDGHSYQNIGQCFQNVEKGSYFAGDAHAVYNKNFKVSKSLELSFEFRTSEQSGILLSVSNPGNQPSLSVELYNGSVVMNADAGDGEISQVINGLDSPFSLCNNEWHSVTALYFNREMTINVDGVRRTWVGANGNAMDEQIEAPLYIGGLPDGAQKGSLKTSDNFKGCIRNIKIGDKIIDWIDMDELNNVLLNSCPVM